MFDEFSFVHSEIEIEEEEELSFHEVDFGEREDGSVSSPVFVLGRRVCETFGNKGDESPATCARS